MMNVLTLENGKYELRHDLQSGALCAYRYGEPWQDFTGNKFIYLLMEAALASKPASTTCEATDDCFSFSKEETEVLRNHPAALALLMDHHEFQQEQADSIFEGEYRPQGNADRRKVLYEYGRRIMTEDIGIWSNDLRKQFGFPLYEQEFKGKNLSWPLGWRIVRNPDGVSIGIHSPPPIEGESPRTSDAVYASTNRDLYELLGKLADHIEAS